MNIALNGDTVIVENGTYTGPGDVDLDFGGRNITVTSQNGAAKTIIDCGGSASSNGTVSHRGFVLASGETHAVISGLTIENGYEPTSGFNSTSGGGICSFGSILTVQSCILENNTAYSGGGIYGASINGGYNPGTSNVTVINCLFIGNSAPFGSGLYVSEFNGSSTVTNCTFTGNTSANGSVYNDNNSGGYLYLFNTILYGDIGGEITLNTVGVFYSDIQGGSNGVGDIIADPLFVSASDFHLQASSPCLGTGAAPGAPGIGTAGAPTTTIDGRTRPNPPSIGAYEVYLAPTFVVVVNASGIAGQAVTLSASLNLGSRGLPGAMVQFSVDGTAVGTAVTGDNSTSSGPARLSYTIPVGFAPGSHTITATFSGDATDLSASGTGTLTVAAVAGTAATQVRFAPRVGFEQRMVGGKFQGSNDGTTYTDLATITQAPTANQYTTLAFASPAAYRFLRYLAPSGAYGNIAELEFDSGTGISLAKITGTPFGTAGSYNNAGNSITKAFDGSTATYFDAPAPGNSDFVGIDRGIAAATQVRFAPRVGFESRMVGGKFQGSTDGITYTDLATITQKPLAGQYTALAFATPAAYRFLRYLAPSGAYGNIAELEFDSGSGASLAKISGTAFGTAGSYNNGGNSFAKAFDGSTATFFDAPAPGNGDFAGIDQGKQ